MNERVIQIRKSLGLTQKQFAEKIGLTQTGLSSIENNACNVTKQTLLTICSVFNVNDVWLHTGKGEMFNLVDKKYEEFFSIFNNLNLPLQDFLYKTALNLLDTQSKL